ncbi:MAG: acyl-CoA dehydrogenase family protein [Vicinamibacterales bacterium]
MNFDLTPLQQEWRTRGTAVGRSLSSDATAADVVRAAAQTGLLESQADLLAQVLALEALASESPSSAMALALHLTCALSLPAEQGLIDGRVVGALTLATDEIPLERDGRLNGRASWVAPLTEDGVALVGVRSGAELAARLLRLSAPGVVVEQVSVAGLRGVVMGHLLLTDAVSEAAGETRPVMARARTLIAAVGLGVARRAVREALGSARGTSQGAGGEQTAQGLIADAATDLDAAMLLTWKAASSPLSLGLSSMAKLAATVAAQRAVERATQVVGAESFREGHIIERLTQDVRALELFAGRTEALREAVASDQGWTE